MKMMKIVCRVLSSDKGYIRDFLDLKMFDLLMPVTKQWNDWLDDYRLKRGKLKSSVSVLKFLNELQQGFPKIQSKCLITEWKHFGSFKGFLVRQPSSFWDHMPDSFEGLRGAIVSSMLRPGTEMMKKTVITWPLFLGVVMVLHRILLEQPILLVGGTG
jgi:hypothetical protein